MSEPGFYWVRQTWKPTPEVAELTLERRWDERAIKDEALWWFTGGEAYVYEEDIVVLSERLMPPEEKG